MRVLVTGSRGFIGKHVAVELERRGWPLEPFDIAHGRDVTEPADFRDLPGDIDAVINLAGMLGTPELFGHEREAVAANIAGAVNVYDFAAKRGIPLVQIGTGHIGQPNPYAITKACAEQLGLARARWEGERITVVRAYHVYGPGQLPGPPHGRASVHKFFPTFACQALTRGSTIRLHGGGGQVIDPVHVSEVARVLVDAIRGPYGEVTEAGCGKPVTVRETAELILAAATVSYPILLQDAEVRPGEPPDARVLASSPACSSPWPYKVAETVDWYRSYLGQPPPSG